MECEWAPSYIIQTKVARWDKRAIPTTGEQYFCREANCLILAGVDRESSLEEDVKIKYREIESQEQDIYVTEAVSIIVQKVVIKEKEVREGM